MDTPDLDEEEKARKKAEIVAYREKKRKSAMFMFAATVFEIIETLVIMVAAFLIVSFILLRVCNPDSPTVQLVFQVMTVVIFLGSIVGGFLIYKKVMRWVIGKYNLDKVLSDEILYHYYKKSDRGE